MGGVVRSLRHPQFGAQLPRPDLHGAFHRPHLPRHRQSLLPRRSVGQGPQTLARSFESRLQPALSPGRSGTTSFEITSKFIENSSKIVFISSFFFFFFSNCLSHVNKMYLNTLVLIISFNFL